MKYILFVFSLIIVLIFLFTVPPTIYLGDSGEIASASFNLGIGHPPGYPLFLLLGKIFTLMPVGDEAFRINFLSIILSVVFALLLFMTVKKFLLILFKNHNFIIDFLSVTTSLIFIFSNDFFNIATNIKGGIYVFNGLIVLISVYSAMKYYFDNDKRFMNLSLYCAGFMPVAHQTSLFVMVFLLSVVLFISLKRQEKNIFHSIFLFLLSFTTSWFYLFIRYKTAINVWAGIDSINLLLGFIARKVYINQNDPNFTLIAGISKFFWYIKNYFINFNVLFLFLISGFAVLYKRHRNFFWLNIFVFLSNLLLIIFFTYNGNSPEFYYINKSFYLLNNLFSMFYVALGIYSLMLYLKNKSRIIQYICFFLLIIFAIYMTANGFMKNDRSRQFLAYDHGINILKTVNDEDKIFGKSDIYIFNIQYIKMVKNQYLEKTVYDQSGNVLDISIYKHIREKGVLDRKKQELAEIELYFKNPNNVYFMDMTSYPEYNLITRPYGILHKLTENSIRIKGTENLMKIYSIRDLYNCKYNDYFYRYIIGRYLVRQAEYAAIGSRINEFEFYKNYAEKIAGEIPNIVKNIASIYFHNFMDIKNTLKYLEKAIGLDSYDFAALNLIISLYHELGMKENVIYWLKFYYEKEWRKELKEKILKQINYLSSRM